MNEMNEKRTEQLNIRVTPEMKKALQEEASKLDWTATKLAEKILREWLNGAKEKNGAMQFIIGHNNTINIS